MVCFCVNPPTVRVITAQTERELDLLLWISLLANGCVLRPCRLKLSVETLVFISWIVCRCMTDDLNNYIVLGKYINKSFSKYTQPRVIPGEQQM